MNSSAVRKLAFILSGCALCAAPHLSAADSGSAARARTHQALNLARLAAGASLEVQLPNQPLAANPPAANALLRDDDPLGYSLPAGTTTFIVSLPKIEVVNRFNFLNLTAAGSVSLAVTSAHLAADSPQWQAVAGQDFSGNDSVVTCPLGSVEAKYVRVTFALAAEGRVDTFGLFGQRTRSSASPNKAAAAGRHTAPSDLQYLMFTDVSGSDHGGVVMVSSGEDLDAAQQIADGDMGTAYAFKANDPAPMAVIDLGSSRPLSRVSVDFKAGAGRLDVYLIGDPAKREAHSGPDATGAGDARTIEAIVAKDFPGDRTPVLAVDTGRQPGLNRVGANINQLNGRYLVMMFHPLGPMPATGGADFKDRDFKDFKDIDGSTTQASPVAGQPLEIAEITAYGSAPTDTALTTPNVPANPQLPGTATKPSNPAQPVFPPSSGTNDITP